MKLKFTWQYALGFVSLTGILGMTHELSHHILASFLCKCIGTITFTFASVCESCDTPYFWLIAISAPIVFNYLPMWIGFFMMCKKELSKQLFGLTLVFCAMPLLRIGVTLFETGDEATFIHQVFGNNETAFLWMKIIVLAVALPPLIKAFLILKNNYKIVWYSGILIIPALFIFYVIGIFLEGLLTEYHFLDYPILGVPILFLLVNALCCLGYYFHRKALYNSYVK